MWCESSAFFCSRIAWVPFRLLDQLLVTHTWPLCSGSAIETRRFQKLPMLHAAFKFVSIEDLPVARCDLHTVSLTRSNLRTVTWAIHMSSPSIGLFAWSVCLVRSACNCRMLGVGVCLDSFDSFDCDSTRRLWYNMTYTEVTRLDSFWRVQKINSFATGLSDRLLENFFASFFLAGLTL